MYLNIAKDLNVIILSMLSKQIVLKDLESDLFQLDIYDTYIEKLMDLNLELLNLNQAKERYKKLIGFYFEGQIKNPDIIIDELKRNYF